MQGNNKYGRDHVIYFRHTAIIECNCQNGLSSLTVDAALSGDRRLFVEALLADGSVTDPEVASRMADEALEAHRQYLPNFS